MTAEVRILHNTAKSEARRVLKDALALNLKEVIVLGICPDGSFYSEATDADCYRVMWLLENYKYELLVAAANERREQK